MPRIRFDFDSFTLEADLLDTPTAKGILAALPLKAEALTWGEEVYFDVPVRVKREADARAVVTPGRLPIGRRARRSRFGFGRTLISKGDECRLASPCNIFAKALGDAKALAKVRAGSQIRVTVRA